MTARNFNFHCQGTPPKYAHLVEYDVQSTGMYVGSHRGLELFSERPFTAKHEQRERAAAVGLKQGQS